MSFEPKWKQITVVGCGLIGSSFARAVKMNTLCERILGWDISASNLNDAIALGVIDGVDPAFAHGGFSDADFLYLAMPALSIIDFLTRRVAQTRRGAIITDAGSTKRLICETASKYVSADRYFIGGHPIAGSHLSGARNGTSDLMLGADYVLIDDESVDRWAFDQVKRTVQKIGARPRSLTVEEHDRVFAIVSHLPQLLSGALASTVSDQGDAQQLLEFAGRGYKDMTRLADSSWSMWRDLLVTNRTEISRVLDQLIDKLTSIREELYRDNVQDDSVVSTLFWH